MKHFFLHKSAWKEPYVLEGQEAIHLAKVLRIKEREEITLLDGEGTSGIFEVKKINKNSVLLEMIQSITHAQPISRTFLAPAYTKAARRSWIFEKSVELEASGIWFWQAERSMAKAPEDEKKRWYEQMIAGAKQCENPWLPDLRTFPSGAEELAATAAPFTHKILLWEDATSQSMLSFDSLGLPGDTIFVMGPEGGLTEAEVNIFMQHGFTPVSLGKRILRWETAALLCLGLGWWAGEVREY